MDYKTILKHYISTCDYLASRQIKSAFDTLHVLIKETLQGDYINLFEQYQTTYKYMLHYTVDGIQDPNRKEIYANLLTSIYALLDKVKEHLFQKQGAGYIYAEKKKFLSESSTSFDAPTEHYIAFFKQYSLKKEENIDLQADLIAKDTITSQVFNWCLFTDYYTDSMLSRIQLILEDKDVPEYEKGIIISAATLNLLRNFDLKKFEFLMQLSENAPLVIKQRARVGLVLALHQYSTRVSLYPEISERLQHLAENKEFLKSIENIFKQFIRSKDTEKITRKMHEDILPDIMKVSPQLKNKLNLDHLMDDLNNEDKNPEWKEILDDVPGLTGKIEELTNLQQEGADVFMSTFSQLKNFPFFNKLTNWLYPFTEEHPEIQESMSNLKSSTFIKTLTTSAFLCNSDKYSFILSMQHMPSSYKDMMSKAVEAEMGQFEEIQNDEKLTNPEKTAEFESNKYIQDLYRLTKLHRNKTDFPQIFDWSFNFFDLDSFNCVFEGSDLLRNTAEFYFLKGHYNMAARAFNKLVINNNEQDKELYQKLGFCYQKLGKFSLALEHYKKADILQSNESWTLKKLALCYRNLKDPQQALSYYAHAAKLQPNNKNILLNIAHCHYDLGNYDDALQAYFKLEYMDSTNDKVWHPIAWISFLTNKLDQAQKYYTKIIGYKPTHHDYINAGHVEWVLGNRKVALTFYRMSIVEYKTDFTEFESIFNEDTCHLVEKGVNAEDIPFLLDKLRYDISSDQ